MTSHGRQPDKERREFRRRNHMVRDLRTPKYSQRVVRGHPRPPEPTIEDGLEEWELDEFDQSE